LMIRQAISPRLAMRIFLNMGRPWKKSASSPVGALLLEGGRRVNVRETWPPASKGTSRSETLEWPAAALAADVHTPSGADHRQASDVAADCRGRNSRSEQPRAQRLSVRFGINESAERAGGGGE
jgi:hypothetical protein